VLTGLVVLHERFTLQLFDLETMVHEVDDGVRVPVVAAVTGRTEHAKKSTGRANVGEKIIRLFFILSSSLAGQLRIASFMFRTLMNCINSYRQGICQLKMSTRVTK
jgi:hypothetical protein